MSWFLVPNALKDFTKKVQNVLPKLDKETLEKLTLTSPELLAERERIDQEERYKENIKNMISLMPWETRDSEREMLVEECKEAIFKLSGVKCVFSGPFLMPEPTVNLNDVDPLEVTKSEDSAIKNETEESASADEALRKLKTLEPLPPLLRNFELNAHVGVIEKLLKVDPKLVDIQSTSSGGGEHERIFWKNYFFHCAWCRYEAGLSIDEIWSDHPTQSLRHVVDEAKRNIGSDEETITLGDSNEVDAFKKAMNLAVEGLTGQDTLLQVDHGGVDLANHSAEVSEYSSFTVNSISEPVDFELIGREGDDADADYELDELEAEIARELED